MKCAAVLNGCSANFISQTEEINGFILKNEIEISDGTTIIIYCDEERRHELINNAPFKKVKLLKVKRYQPENILRILNITELNEHRDLYLFASDYSGNELSVRFASCMKGASLVNVNKIKIQSGQFTFFKSVYSNHLQGEFRLNKKPRCISIAKGCVDNISIKKQEHQIVDDIDGTNEKHDSFIVEYKFEEQKVDNGFQNSKFIFIAGRGLKNRENTEKLKVISDTVGAKVGVTRPVAMSGWASMNELVGVSGNILKPDLCLVAGASGAAAFYAGIEKSNYIVAINTDQNASIIKSSDVVIIDDYERVLDALYKLIIGEEK